jgi:hypothetical protein
MRNNENPQAELLEMFAIAHMSMLCQTAKGEIKMSPGEVDEREAWLMGYIRNGVGLVTDENRRMAEVVNAALSTQPAEIGDPLPVAPPAEVVTEAAA